VSVTVYLIVGGVHIDWGVLGVYDNEEVAQAEADRINADERMNEAKVVAWEMNTTEPGPHSW
jgi:hypothetical protein